MKALILSLLPSQLLVNLLIRRGVIKVAHVHCIHEQGDKIRGAMVALEVTGAAAFDVDPEDESCSIVAGVNLSFIPRKMLEDVTHAAAQLH